MFKAVKNTVVSQIISVTSLCLVVVLMGVVFASQAYSTAVDAVNIKREVTPNVWNIDTPSSSYKELEGSVVSTYHKVLSNVVINEFILNTPEEYFEYSFMIENKGNVEAILKAIQIDGLNDNLKASIKLNALEFDSKEENIFNVESENYITIKVESKPLVENTVFQPQAIKLVTTLDLEQKETEE